MDRRSFLTGLGISLIAAPAIVRAGSLMPVRGIVMAVNPAVIGWQYGFTFTTTGELPSYLEKGITYYVWIDRKSNHTRTPYRNFSQA